jgi:hypothetical protein
LPILGVTRPFLGSVRLVKDVELNQFFSTSKLIIILIISISSYLIYPIRGGVIYRGIYDIGLKGAFMGYRPFIDCPPDRDRMMGCVCGYRSLYYFRSLCEWDPDYGN